MKRATQPDGKWLALRRKSLANEKQFFQPSCDIIMTCKDNTNPADLQVAGRLAGYFVIK